MKLLEDMSIGHRVALTMIIVLIILFALAAYGFFSGAWDQAEGAQGPRLQSAIPGEPASTWDSRMFALDREALDDAYKEHVKHLFLTILRAGDPGAGERAIVGAKNMRKYYVKIQDAIDAREKASQEELERKKGQRP